MPRSLRIEFPGAYYHVLARGNRRETIADKSRAQSAWAAVYYFALRERGMTHAQALRCLGQRWLKIIWKMWQTGTAYNAALHMRNQLAHGSWVLQIQST